MLGQTLIHVAIYAAGTFYANPVKVVLNAAVGSSYGVAYAHFRRDHSVALNVWLHAMCMVIQVSGNFALLEVWDRAVFGASTRTGLATGTALLWALFLGATPSPVSVRLGSIGLIGAGLLGRQVLANNFVGLTLAQAPFEVACYWLIMPDHGLRRPSKLGLAAMLAVRVALWYAVRPLYGAVNLAVINFILVTGLVIGSLVRAKDNMPYAEHVGLAAWLPALVFDKPWLFFLCGSFVGQALQGVAHDVTKQEGTLPQLKDARHELAHCSYFPNLVIQSIHHSFFGAHPATVKALGDYKDVRSRKAMGLDH